MLENRKTFELRTNRFEDEKYTAIEYSCLQMTKNLKSINDKDNSFTNFSTSIGTNKYIAVRKMYNENKKDINILNKYFQSDELINDKDKNDNIKINRLRKILENNGEVLTFNDIVNNVIKFKYNEDNEIQFFVYRNNKVLNLVLIDLYHLGIYAKKNNKYIWKEKYNKLKGNKCDLKYILN